jgi:hypothetical protein
VLFRYDIVVFRGVRGGAPWSLGGAPDLLTRATRQPTVELRNAILWANAEGLVLGHDLGTSPPAVGADHDDIGTLGFQSDPFTDLGGNLSVDPQILRGYELASTSPLVDAGTSAWAPRRWTSTATRAPAVRAATSARRSSFLRQRRSLPPSITARLVGRLP